MQGVHPKDVCGVDGCNSVFHHMHQTEWEMYQYHVEFPDGDSKDCIYDSDGKKRCIHHHPHSKLALPPNMPSTKEDASEKLPTTQVLYEGKKSHPTTGDEKQEGPSNPSKSSVDSSKIIDEDASSKIDGDEQLKNCNSDHINTDGDVLFDGSSDPCESNEESLKEKN
jgi:hypothetical protein